MASDLGVFISILLMLSRYDVGSRVALRLAAYWSLTLTLLR
jgi:hypothetical protein